MGKHIPLLVAMAYADIRTLAILSDLTGISRSSLSYALNGRDPVTPERQAKIARLLGVSADTLFAPNGYVINGHIDEHQERRDALLAKMRRKLRPTV